MKEICTLEHGRWSATVSKIKAGTLEARPDATLCVEVRGDGRLIARGDNGPPVDCSEIDWEDRELPEEWAKRHGLPPLSARDIDDYEYLSVLGQRLVWHIDQGGSWQKWMERNGFQATRGWKQTL